MSTNKIKMVLDKCLVLKWFNSAVFVPPMHVRTKCANRTRLPNCNAWHTRTLEEASEKRKTTRSAILSFIRIREILRHLICVIHITCLYFVCVLFLLLSCKITVHRNMRDAYCIFSIISSSLLFCAKEMTANMAKNNSQKLITSYQFGRNEKYTARCMFYIRPKTLEPHSVDVYATFYSILLLLMGECLRIWYIIIYRTDSVCSVVRQSQSVYCVCVRVARWLTIDS